MTTLISFDPGKSTGIVIGHYSETDPWVLADFYQISGGLQGFLDWERERTGPRPDLAVSERFVPLSGQGFSHTADSVEALRVEGALVALGYMHPDATSFQWQRPALQYWTTGQNAAERRRKQKAWVKENHPHLYKTGKNVGHKDAEDYWSALFHSLAYMRRIEHRPTLDRYFPNRARS